jgi:ribose-phosphate pyrophosphokinase
LFDVSCDNLFTTKILRKWFTDNLFKDADYDKKFVLISPDEGAMKKTRIIANILGLPFLTMSKTRDYKTENHVEQIVLLFPHDQNRDDQSVLRGKTAIIVDDMIDTAGTVIQAVDKLMEFGAVGCGVTATHGVLSGPALERINKCDALKFVLVSDTLPQTENQRKSSKIQVYSIADMLAEVIRRVTVDHSLSSLF